MKKKRIISLDSVDLNYDPIKELQRDCVFLDNCSSLLKLKLRIKQRKKFPGVLITSVSPSIAKEIKFDRIIRLSPLDQSDVVKIVKNRVKMAGDQHSLPDNFYKTVARCSIGNPLRALQVAKELIQNLFDHRNEEDMDNTIFENFVKNHEEIRNKIVHGWSGLSTKEITIIDILLKGREPNSITPRELGIEIEGGRTLAWKYLERLVEKKYLNKFYRGKSSIYELKIPIKIMLETLSMGDKI